MVWVRSHLPLGSRLALLALGIQLALSVVHAHFAVAGGLIAAAATVAEEGAASAAAADRSDSSGKSNQPSDVFCPVCALIQLAAITLPSAPPALELPFDARAG